MNCHESSQGFIKGQGIQPSSRAFAATRDRFDKHFWRLEGWIFAIVETYRPKEKGCSCIEARTVPLTCVEASMSYRYTQAVLDGPRSLRCGKLNVMQALAEWANDEGVSWHPISEIADRARLQERAVKYVLSALEAEGFLTIERGVGRGNTSRYTIVFKALSSDHIKGAISAENVQFVADEKVQNLAENVQKVTENVQFSAEKVQIPSRGVNRQEPSELTRNEPSPPTPPQPETGQESARDAGAGSGGGKIIHLFTNNGRNSRPSSPGTWVHEGAAIVLGANDLTEGQHDMVLDFCDGHRDDERLTAELVEYAAGICKAKNKRDLRYYFGILGKRLDDPAWVDVPTELANSPFKKGGNGYGAEAGENGQGRPNGTFGNGSGGSGQGIIGVIEAQSKPINPNFKAALERGIARNGHH